MNKDKNAVKMGAKGGDRTKELYGPEHFRNAANKRWADQKAKDPDAGKKQSLKMLEARRRKASQNSSGILNLIGIK